MRRALAPLLALALAACAGERPDAPPLRVWAAASLTRPVRAVLDSFTARTGVVSRLESQSSLELARRITDLGETPDVLLLADRAVFPALLAPAHVDRWTLFARNRIVVAWGARARHAAEFARAERWWEILDRPGVEVGRADPATDPSGYRTLLVFQLAERHYGVPGLAARLLAAAPPRNVRPREADQIALVETGELDYVWTYENLARAARLPYRVLPPAVDLGSIPDSAAYAAAAVRVPGRRLGDSVTFRGEPIAYALAVPRAAERPAEARALVDFLLSPDGRRILRAQSLDALDSAVTVTAPAP
ncbi:extracellular solute-binding protein [Roseisolibacter sp. H3M3-2]|uniref:extracellular solute-binding protein n=1 Tax=Roseisolibacter sp. H3M3-2 TaxID=3031323 RepID=UPI0023DAA463|nr:extracellular solute-binding protein [Roseisolibacter sp. H3M3-2]MDF1502077.1 extracellular solute-binding protein [Roseisolibacter sp. H3M3-2]